MCRFSNLVLSIPLKYNKKVLASTLIMDLCFSFKYFPFSYCLRARYVADETRSLIDAWVRDSPLKNITLKDVIVMSSLLLEKPSKDSKAKDHTKPLERKLQLWTDGDRAELLKEDETIHRSL